MSLQQIRHHWGGKCEPEDRTDKDEALRQNSGICVIKDHKPITLIDCILDLKSSGGLVAKLCLTLLRPHGLYVALQAPLSMGFSRQEYWSGLLFPSPGDLPNPGIEPGLLHCR